MPDNRIIEVDGIKYVCFPAEEALAIFSDLCTRLGDATKFGCPRRSPAPAAAQPADRNGTGTTGVDWMNVPDGSAVTAPAPAGVRIRRETVSVPHFDADRGVQARRPKDSSPLVAVPASTFYGQVLKVIQLLGECDAAAIVAETEQRGLELGEDPEKQVCNAIHASLKPKGLIEKTGRFGYWRAQ